MHSTFDKPKGCWFESNRGSVARGFAAGFYGVTSHNFRRAVATLMYEAGLCAPLAPDQLGHPKPSLTGGIYMRRKRRATGAAEVLEDLFGPDWLDSWSAASWTARD